MTVFRSAFAILMVALILVPVFKRFYDNIQRDRRKAERAAAQARQKQERLEKRKRFQPSTDDVSSPTDDDEDEE